MGSLTTTERREKCNAQAVEYSEVKIKREDTRRTSTVLFVILNKKTYTVSALELQCALSTEHSECTQHLVHNKS